MDINIVFFYLVEITLLLGLNLAVILYFHFFYPKQTMPLGVLIDIKTPQEDKYHNDCLHPCIRCIPEGFAGAKFWMVQSPYYNRDSNLENPILYFSKDLDNPIHWEYTVVVNETPTKGYNSDPCLFYEENKLWVFWRECNTPRCDEFGASKLTVGVYTLDGYNFSEPKVYLIQQGYTEDKEQCPILIKKDGRYLFYGVNYQYKPKRKSKGLVIWEGSSLLVPDFFIKVEIPFKTVYACDKYKQVRLFSKLWFIPKPLKYDLWHFDLFEYENKLYMVSVAEWGENIMMSISHDYMNFHTNRKPLQNTHYAENKNNIRSYFYKPTAFVENGNLHLYFTSTCVNDKYRNILNLSKLEM